MKSVIVCAILVIAGNAIADDTPPREPVEPDPVKLVGDVRGMLYVRDDNNYFRHAQISRYDISSAAGGVELTLGLVPMRRLSFSAEGFYVVDGADRGDARLRLTSGAIVGVAKYALAAVETKEAGAHAAVAGGFGRYFLRERFLDPGLSPMVYAKDASSYGGFVGIEGAMHVAAFRVVLRYAYHVARAEIDDRIRGSVDAGGHEISIGIGAVL
jgi:hypothetical protein